MCKTPDTLIPQVGVITDIWIETPEVKTFRIVGLDGKKAFAHMPGQCAMISVPGVGEAMFSMTSSPKNEAGIDFSIKRAGKLTAYLHAMEVGDQLTIRGPYGNFFPVDTVFNKQNLLLVAGGVGLAPVSAAVRHVFDNRDNYGSMDIVYGARSMEDLVFFKEIEENWRAQPDTRIHLTIDREQSGWTGHVGFCATVLKELHFSPDRLALVCGPPIMIKRALATLLEMGFKKEQIYTTLELRMKCGVGKCGRCNLGTKFVCIDGPVFRFDEIDALPDEY